MLKLKISGYYKAGKNIKVNYNSVDAVIPNCPKEMILGNVINRVVPVLFPDYIERGKCFVDKVTEDDKMKADYEGKEIKSLEEKEIQQLAIAYNLTEVPLYHQCSLAEARRIAYRAYCNKVKGQKLEIDFDYENSSDFTIGKKSKVESKG